MFTLIRNYRAMFMLMIANYQESPEGSAAAPEAEMDPEALKAMIESAEFAAVEGVTQEDIRDLSAAHEHFSNGGIIERGENSAIAKDVQEMLIYLNFPMTSVDGSKTYGADGDFGGATERAVRRFQEAKGLQVDGVVGNGTYTTLLSEISERRQSGETSLSEAAVEEAVEEAVTQQETTPETHETFNSEHALAALEAIKTDSNAVKALQQALIDAGEDLGSYGADGSAGRLTRAAVESNPEVALSALAAYIDTTDDENVTERLSAEKPADGDAIDAALTEYFDGDPSTTRMAEIVAQFTGDVDSHTRNANAQYMSLWLQANGYEDNLIAQRMMEAVMAEGAGHYEQETTELQIRQALIDGSGRFARGLGRFPENFNGSYYRIRQTLQGAGGRARVENGMETGISGTAGDITKALFGVDGEYLATRIHVVTGQGTDGDADMSIELSGGIELSNAYYDEESGAIYAVVAKGNGCEGNLVVIPVETFVPPVIVPRTTPTPTPVPTDIPEEDIPEEEGPGRRCRYLERCRGGRVEKRLYCWDSGTWGKNPTYGPWEQTDERCGNDDDDDPTPETEPTTTPGGSGDGEVDTTDSGTAEDDTNTETTTGTF